MTPRRSQRVGRPRLDGTSEAILSDDRRTQVRRAQRTYRLKKEAIFRNATARAEQLEATIRTAIEEAAGLSEVATEAQLQLSHPDLHARLKRLQEILADESSSDPGEIYRVFRLVPCVRDPDKTQPRFRQLLLGGCTDSLEVPGLPFYSIGGAGTHFPDVDGEGNAVYPANSRMPRRILGLLPWAELGTKGGGDTLEVFGLGGDWFDCRDVEGYLKLHGVEVDGGLLSGLVILGRAPGFRKTDVRRRYKVLGQHPYPLYCDTKHTATMALLKLEDQIAIEPIGTDCYRSIVPPICMGDLADWAYGGNILAVAVNAAYATVTEGQHLYSISGHFVRPASPFQKLICRVERIRSTRTFQTRLLRIVQPEGKIEQLCLIATADFHIDEPADLVNYSTRPKLLVPSTPAVETATEKTQERGLYRILDTMMEVHPHSTDLEGKDVSDIVSADRFRIQGALHTEANRIAALAFYMDRGLAYVPANHSGYSLFQASACATLEFALRILTHELDLQNWHVSERQTFWAGNARALSEGRVFTEDGRFLASMTQKTILRPQTGTAKM
ncbi:thioesterase/thiol ester dehydrase-isomerase [Aspergillus terreus]|uniref:Thioesterase/thiol ester dehydrase-isomerase n=1 Tax=Aspergillus terreus TaxID=33178 RepID=A0A5M3Z648_ASPTE|nr:hypothetical protein ATETN484_0010022600 [Aspergillus terreus]GFF18273.1 thioesterase/thiol ester dehydrase-isomerase [Aspergillus terreus]